MVSVKYNKVWVWWVATLSKSSVVPRKTLTWGVGKPEGRFREGGSIEAFDPQFYDILQEYSKVVWVQLVLAEREWF